MLGGEGFQTRFSPSQGEGFLVLFDDLSGCVLEAFAAQEVDLPPFGSTPIVLHATQKPGKLACKTKEPLK